MIYKTLSLAAIATLSVSCGGKKSQFASYSPATLELTRNEDGQTADVDAAAIYTSADAEPSDVIPADLSSKVEEEDSVSAVLETKTEVTPPTEVVDPAVTSVDPVSPDTVTVTSVPTEATPEEEKPKPNGKKDELKEKDKEEAASPETTAVESESSSSEDTSLVNACLAALGQTELTAESFVEESVTGKNRNNQVLFKDEGGSNDPLLLKIYLKNVNKSSIELLNPERTYCIDMQVKNMNKFQFKFHCDAKVAFVNLKKKNDNKSSTLRVDCK